MGLLPASLLSLPRVFAGLRDWSTLGSWCSRWLLVQGETGLHLFPPCLAGLDWLGTWEDRVGPPDPTEAPYGPAQS